MPMCSVAKKYIVRYFKLRGLLLKGKDSILCKNLSLNLMASWYYVFFDRM